jgi:L-asparaginase II
VADAYVGGEPLAEVVRSGFVESRHAGSVVVLDADGEVAAWAGDVLGPIFPRSANKPLQAVGMLRAGLALPPADLALVSASHRGQPFHIHRVLAMLRDAGLTPSALGCPPDYPLCEEARDAVIRAGGARAPLLMNCSGKHAGMLRTCVVNGWPTEDYLVPEHPVQRRIAATFADLVGEPVVAVGVDGCGAPLLSASLRGLAAGFLRLVDAAPGTPERAVADAMRAHPEMVAGTDADGFDTHLMRGIPGLIAKGGAEGVLAVAAPGVGAVTMKIDDGAMRPRLPVLRSALVRLGLDAAVLTQFTKMPVFGGGRAVGVVNSRW